MNQKLSALKVFVHSQKDKMKHAAFSLKKSLYVAKTKKLFQSPLNYARQFHLGREDVIWIRQGLLVSAFLTIGIGTMIGIWYMNLGLEIVVAGGIVLLPWVLLAPRPNQIVETENRQFTEVEDPVEIGRIRGRMEYEVIPLDFGVKAEGQIWHDPEGRVPDSIIIKAPGIYIQISDPEPKRSDKDIEITVKGENKVLVTV